MIDPRTNPQDAPSVLLAVPGSSVAQHLTFADVGTSAKQALNETMVKEIVFSHANAATVELTGTLLPGMIITAKQSGTGTADHKIKLPSGVTWDGTNIVATIAVQHKYFTAIAVSPTRLVILANDSATFGAT